MALNWAGIRTGLVALRVSAGMTQKGLALASGVGEKTIGSYEAGSRIKTMKVKQLDAILGALGTNLVDFFSSIDESAAAEEESEAPPPRRPAHNVPDDDLDAVACDLARMTRPQSLAYPSPQSSLSNHARIGVHLSRRHSS